MFLDTSDKKDFLTWLVNNVVFAKREVLWILNYLINHEAILSNVHFVEYAEKTPRGIRVTAADLADEPITLFLNGHAFTDTEQIFHEIRLNWKEALYIECLFEGAWQNSQFLSILEDNPHARWNEQVSVDVIEKVDAYLAAEEYEAKLAWLHEQIDLALETGDRAAFKRLSQEICELKAQVPTI